MTGGMRFPALLRRYRERAGFSQARLAQLSGLDHSYLSRLESGRRMPTREVVLRLAEALALGSEETDRLLVAAGFAPVSSRAALDPDLEQAARLLQDAGVPAEVRIDLRDALRVAIRMAERAATSASRGGET
jgi:transcriptional regulator with XRE-family HTH domain